MQLSELYPELDRQLTTLNAEMDATECHGVLCARFCVELRPAPADWVYEVLGDQDSANLQVQAAQVSLAHLYQYTEQVFLSGLEDFRLLLPDDDQDLQDRLQALVDWCGGFISGLGLCGVQINDSLDPTVREIMDDLIEMTHMDVDVEDTDENEAAFTEIVEYVRISLMTIGLTLRPASEEKAESTLH